ncbi:MAG: 4-(cytidine 5'-diphospho)-2-C-methyl-D-erythritol kinase [Candidatus Omnitrophota bacterium]|nr:4-(cytidine 5'-diphospho)-2-C-methyl-D-erythritol kinase [Candidatus Omnitrophota bacterium]
MAYIELNSPAKINLFLDVFGKRSDGYHDIITIFEKIDLCDTIRLEGLPSDEIRITSGNKELPLDETNLAYKAAMILKDTYNVPAGVSIHIDKKIPIAAGLGGGSSNAATALKGLNKLWKLGLGNNTLAGIGNKLGADVPFFIFNYPFAVGVGKGDEISPIKSTLEMWHLIISPPAKVLTKDVYDVYKETSLNLTEHRPDVKMMVHAIRKGDLGSIKNSLHNALEPIVNKKVAYISKVKDFVKKMGFNAVNVTGSGPTIFVLTNDRKEAEGLKKKVREYFEEKANNGWGIFVVKTAIDDMR